MSDAAVRPHAPPLAAVGLVAGGSLALEVLLTRLLAIVQWHHFAFMAVSVALLGIGASGTWLALRAESARRHARRAFARDAALFALASLVCVPLAQAVPFNPLELAWTWRQLGWLGLVYVLLALPFFFAGTAIGRALMAAGPRTGAVYGADLAGAGIGAALAPASLLALRVEHAVVLASVAGAAAAAACLGRRAVLGAGAVLAVGGALVAGLPAGVPPLAISEFKGLSQALEVAGARLGVERSGPLGRVQTVENERVPVRHAPGLALGAPAAPAPQVAVFVDAEGPLAITRFPPDASGLGFLDAMVSALPYHVRARPSVLVLGAGPGLEVLQALVHGARRVDAVELDPNLVALVREDYRGFAGDLYGRDDVRVVVAEARGFLERTGTRYDVIQVPASGAFGASVSGLFALAEGHLHTVEGIGATLDALAPGGFAAWTSWVRLPPREAPKLIATVADALRARGVDDPGARMAMVRSWSASTLIVKNGALTTSEVEDVRTFARRWSFDLVHLPGMRREEANRHNVLREPMLFDAARALLGPERDAFLARYKFDLRPATDDRPYFRHFFRWDAAREILALRARGGIGLVELGYLVLVATLLQALVLGAVLVLAPLAALRGHGDEGGVRAGRAAIAVLALGLAFLLVEIAFIQKTLLFVHHPVYATAVVLASFLVFAGLGARRAGAACRTGEGVPRLRRPVGAIVVSVLVVLAVLALATPVVAGWPAPARLLAAVALVAPIAFPMGMPFPALLEALGARAPGLVPWAWGLNGWASVVGAVLAAVLALHLGFTTVMLVAAALYVLAAAVGEAAFGGRVA